MSKYGRGKVRRLDKMVIGEISLVDFPASPGATVALYKRHAPTEDDSMTTKTAEELAKALTTAESDAKALTKRATDAEAKVTDLTTQIEALNKRVADAEQAAKDAGAANASEDDILKGITDPGLKAYLTKQAAESKALRAIIAKNADETLTKRFIDSVAGLDHLTIEADKLGPILKRCSTKEATDEDMGEITRVLKAANAAVAEAMEKGGTSLTSSTGVPGSKSLNKRAAAEQRLETLAKAAQVANPKLTYADAYAAILETPEGSKAYAEYVGD